MTPRLAVRHAGERIRRAGRAGCAMITAGALLAVAAVAAAGHPTGG
jgi:hypothetical protein